MKRWLMKSEPDCYSIDDLERASPDIWEGCRNYTIRNWFRDEFSPGDLAFFYNSNSQPLGIAGVMRVVRGGYPDPTQLDPDSRYFDPKSSPNEPRWLAVDVEFVEKWDPIVTLAELRAAPELEGMAVLRKGQRLSVMPVTDQEWDLVLRLRENRETSS